MRLLVLPFYLLCLISCSQEKSVQQTELLQLHKDDQVKVHLSPGDAPVEEILNWTVAVAEGWQIKSAEVTGISMNMGTIPLQFKAVPQQPGIFMAEMVLGACSQPRMKWQLQLSLHHATAGEKLLLLPFYSSWPT